MDFEMASASVRESARQDAFNHKLSERQEQVHAVVDERKELPIWALPPNRFPRPLYLSQLSKQHQTEYLKEARVWMEILLTSPHAEWRGTGNYGKLIHVLTQIQIDSLTEHDRKMVAEYSNFSNDAYKAICELAQGLYTLHQLHWIQKQNGGEYVLFPGWNTYTVRPAFVRFLERIAPGTIVPGAEEIGDA